MTNSFQDELNIEQAVTLIQICNHEPDISRARTALARLKVAAPMLSSLIQQLKRLPDFSLLAASLTDYFQNINDTPIWLPVLVALRANRPELLAETGPEVVTPLVEIYFGKTKKIFRAAREALLLLANPAAQQACCLMALQPDYSELLSLVVEAGFMPQDVHQRALFFFLTKQWRKYESLDFDTSLMRLVYETADDKLRQQIASVGRVAGRPEIIKIMSGRGSRSFSPEEWQLAVNLLLENARWSEAWELVQTAPAHFSLQLLKALIKNNWQPEVLEQQIGFKDLAKRIARLKTPTLSFGVSLELMDERVLFYTEQAGSRVKQVLSADAKTLAILYSGGDIEIWDIGEMSVQRSFSRYELARWRGEDAGFNYEEYEYVLYNIALSPAGDKLALVDYKVQDETETVQAFRVRLFHLASGWADLLTEYKIIDNSIYNDMDIYYYDENFEEYLYLEFYSALDFDPTGKYLAAVLSNKAFIWDIDSLSGQLKQNNMYLGYQDNGQPVFFPDAIHLLLAKSLYRPVNSPLEKVKMSGAAKRFEDWTFVSDATIKMNPNSRTAFSPDGRYLIVTNPAKIELFEFDGKRLTLLQTLHDDNGRIYSLAISPDKTRLAAGYDTFIIIWSLPDFSFVNMFEAHAGAISHLFFSQDGNLLHSLGEDGHYKQWRSPLSELPERPLEATTIRDLLAVRQALLTAETEPDKRWLSFLDGLFSRRYRHDIELGDIAPATEANEFDIELD